MVWIVSAILAFLFVKFLVGLIRAIWPPQPDWYGPLQTPEEIKASSHFVVDHLIEHPDAVFIAQHFKKEAEAAAAHRAYERLNIFYSYGYLSEDEYQEQLEKISRHLDINDVFTS